MNHKNPEDVNNKIYLVDMFYLNTIEQVFLLVEQLDQLVVCLTYNRLLTGIPILAVFQYLRWNSNKTSLSKSILPIVVITVIEYRRAPEKFHMLSERKRYFNAGPLSDLDVQSCRKIEIEGGVPRK